MNFTRRRFLTCSSALAATSALPALGVQKNRKPIETFPFKLSLAQWSNHRLLFKGDLTNLDWPKYVKENYQIDALEYVNQFFRTKAKDASYLNELNTRVNDLGMTNVLIMIDGEGHIGAPSKEERIKTIEKHKKWVEAAMTLGCHSIRVNAYGKGTPFEAAKQVTDGLHQLATFAADFGINILVENHGGNSSNGQWLSKVLSNVNLLNCGSLPDFGNFKEYNRYQGISELMPFAKGVSAKTHKFDGEGFEMETDFVRALRIVREARYSGYIGIEYEGKLHTEDEGIKLTKALLERFLPKKEEK